MLKFGYKDKDTALDAAGRSVKKSVEFGYKDTAMDAGKSVEKSVEDVDESVETTLASVRKAIDEQEVAGVGDYSPPPPPASSAVPTSPSPVPVPGPSAKGTSAKPKGRGPRSYIGGVWEEKFAGPTVQRVRKLEAGLGVPGAVEREQTMAKQREEEMALAGAEQKRRISKAGTEEHGDIGRAIRAEYNAILNLYRKGKASAADMAMLRELGRQAATYGSDIDMLIQFQSLRKEIETKGQKSRFQEVGGGVAHTGEFLVKGLSRRQKGPPSRDWLGVAPAPAEARQLPSIRPTSPSMIPAIRPTAVSDIPRVRGGASQIFAGAPPASGMRIREEYANPLRVKRVEE